jgi:hypothetical protein
MSSHGFVAAPPKQRIDWIRLRPAPYNIDTDLHLVGGDYWWSFYPNFVGPSGTLVWRHLVQALRGQDEVILDPLDIAASCGLHAVHGDGIMQPSRLFESALGRLTRQSHLRRAGDEWMIRVFVRSIEPDDVAHRYTANMLHQLSSSSA